MLKQKAKVKILLIDFENRKNWRVWHNEDEYGKAEIADERFWNDIQNGYYEFKKSTILITDIKCPWNVEEPLKILKVYEVLYV